MSDVCQQKIKSLIVHDNSLLLACCNHSANIDNNSIEISILKSVESGQIAQLKIGVFFREILSGCVCGDDPSAAITYENGYCELQAQLDKTTDIISF